MAQLFKKLAYFTDIHFGRNGNSETNLQDNLEFIQWFVTEARARGCETFIHGGDWHDNRHSIHVATLNASLEGLNVLNDSFERSYFIPGNHDLFFRDRRDVSSISFAGEFKNIEVIDQITTRDEVTFLPWLVGNEIKSVSKPKGRYAFAHLECAGFSMNSKVEMPDSDHASKADQFVGSEAVFTGHFHMRQRRGNIVYTGNVMPFSFSDNWDAERGAMFLDWGGKPEFVPWPGQPLFRTMLLSEMLNEPDKMLCDKLTARVTIDIDVSFEEAQIVKEEMTSTYGLRKVELVHQTKDQGPVITVDVPFQTLDQIMTESLRSVSGAGLKPEKLIEIYKGLSTS